MNSYLVMGTLFKAGTLEDFQIEKDATSSRNAYVSVQDALYNGGCKSVRVTTIKMVCDHCKKAHITIPQELYLQ